MRQSSQLVGGELVTPFGGVPQGWLRGPARALAWCAQRRLDQEIALGMDPFAESLRACEARRLTAMRTRRRLAVAIERLPSAAQDPGRPARVSVPLRRRTVLDAQPALRELANALMSRGPVGSQGVALVLVLLRDAGSPLYGRDGQALTDAVAKAIEGLEGSTSR
jgi:hypothetical protein